jgi:hypothetical protein
MRLPRHPVRLKAQAKLMRLDLPAIKRLQLHTAYISTFEKASFMPKFQRSASGLYSALDGIESHGVYVVLISLSVKVNRRGADFFSHSGRSVNAFLSIGAVENGPAEWHQKGHKQEEVKKLPPLSPAGGKEGRGMTTI